VVVAGQPFEVHVSASKPVTFRLRYGDDRSRRSRRSCAPRSWRRRAGPCCRSTPSTAAARRGGRARGRGALAAAAVGRRRRPPSRSAIRWSPGSRLGAPPPGVRAVAVREVELTLDGVPLPLLQRRPRAASPWSAVPIDAAPGTRHAALRLIDEFGGLHEAWPPSRCGRTRGRSSCSRSRPPPSPWSPRRGAPRRPRRWRRPWRACRRAPLGRALRAAGRGARHLGLRRPPPLRRRRQRLVPPGCRHRGPRRDADRGHQRRHRAGRGLLPDQGGLDRDRPRAGRQQPLLPPVAAARVGRRRRHPRRAHRHRRLDRPLDRSPPALGDAHRRRPHRPHGLGGQRYPVVVRP
jgi:hypothetical protein